MAPATCEECGRETAWTNLVDGICIVCDSKRIEESEEET